MAKVLLICGKICSGKSTLTALLLSENNAVLLSCDEIEQTIFAKQLGENHDKIVSAIKRYLLNKSVDVIKAGCDVILDWGFWSKAERDQTSAYFDSLAIERQWHYIHIDDADWNRNIAQRNEQAVNGATDDYYVDEGLKEKCLSNFEAPSEGEMDCWHINRR